MINKVLNKQFLHTISTIRCATTTNSLRTLCTTFARLQTPPILDFNNEKYQKYLESLRLEFYDLRNNAGGDEKAYARINQLNGVVSALEQYRAVKGNLASKEDLENEKDEDMRQLIKEENEIYGEILVKTEEEIMKQMLNLTDDLQYPSIIFEINAGAGGQEAMLFAKDLFEMYTNFFELHSWEYEILEEDKTDIGGLRHANIIVQEQKAYHILQHEAGVHRVQRVPATEKSGRMHTSTASVAVIPRPANVNVTISEKDLKIETKRASGAGGQHVNTTDSAVRVVHLPTGLAVECQAERSQIKNRETAIKRLQAKLLQRQLQSDEASTQATRKSQQGNLNRNEKIRTYNFVQDRITDHRLQNGTVHNLREFIAGGEPLRNLIQRLVIENRKRKLEQILEDWHKQSDDVKTKSESKSKAKN